MTRQQPVEVQHNRHIVSESHRQIPNQYVHRDSNSRVVNETHEQVIGDRYLVDERNYNPGNLSHSQNYNHGHSQPVTERRQDGNILHNPSYLTPNYR